MIMNKKCMKCGKAATHKFVKIEKNQIYDMYYCEEHAGEKSPYQKTEIPLNEILASFLSQGQQPGAEGGELDVSARCENCGLAFEAYRKTLMLGCPECYESFSDQLLPELRKFHGNVKHVGRKPGGGMELPDESSSVPIESGADVEPPAQANGEPAGAEPSEAEESASKGGAELISDPKSAIDELTREMTAAIAEEDFEKAARCRDQISELKAKI